jgi:hypothetical protein
MAITNHERVGKALEFLRTGLGPFVEREITNVYQDRAATEASRLLAADRLNEKKPIAEWDAAALLKLMWESWNDSQEEMQRGQDALAARRASPSNHEAAR